jgi:hypothetical protein
MEKGSIFKQRNMRERASGVTGLMRCSVALVLGMWTPASSHEPGMCASPARPHQNLKKKKKKRKKKEEEKKKKKKEKRVKVKSELETLQYNSLDELSPVLQHRLLKDSHMGRGSESKVVEKYSVFTAVGNIA